MLSCDFGCFNYWFGWKISWSMNAWSVTLTHFILRTVQCLFIMLCDGMPYVMLYLYCKLWYETLMSCYRFCCDFHVVWCIILLICQAHYVNWITLEFWRYGYAFMLGLWKNECMTCIIRLRHDLKLETSCVFVCHVHWDTSPFSWI